MSFPGYGIGMFGAEGAGLSGGKSGLGFGNFFGRCFTGGPEADNGSALRHFRGHVNGQPPSGGNVHSLFDGHTASIARTGPFGKENFPRKTRKTRSAAI
jgi:hypothetical protein